MNKGVRIICLIMAVLFVLSTVATLIFSLAA